MPIPLKKFLCLLALVPLAADAGQVVSLSEEMVKPFIKKSCIRCHGPEKQKGKLRLDELPLKMSNDSIAAHWQDVLDTLNAGDMPPEEEEQPTKKELTGFLAEFSDGDDLDVLTSQLIKDDLRAKSLIHNLVQSSIFQTK
jgi:hypothetical protein